MTRIDYVMEIERRTAEEAKEDGVEYAAKPKIEIIENECPGTMIDGAPTKHPVQGQKHCDYEIRRKNRDDIVKYCYRCWNEECNGMN